MILYLIISALTLKASSQIDVNNVRLFNLKLFKRFSNINMSFPSLPMLPQ